MVNATSLIGAFTRWGAGGWVKVRMSPLGPEPPSQPGFVAKDTSD